MYREMCEQCGFGDVTQGSIFTGAISTGIESDSALGVVISARCDIENAKDQQYAYVPALKVTDWLSKYAFPKIKEEQLDQKKLEYKRMIVAEGFPENIFDIFPIESINKKIHMDISEKKKLSKIKELWNDIETLSGGSYLGVRLMIRKKFAFPLRKALEAFLRVVLRGQILDSSLLIRLLIIALARPMGLIWSI